MTGPEFERYKRIVVRMAIVGWTVGLAVSLGMGAVAVWAVIRLVGHST